MFIVIEEISPPFSPRPVVYAFVLARLRGIGLAEGTGEGFRGGFFIGGRFWGRGNWLGGRGKCGCAAVWPLETRLAGGAEPLGWEEGVRPCEEEPWLKHCRRRKLRECCCFTVRVTLRIGHFDIAF